MRRRLVGLYLALAALSGLIVAGTASAATWIR
jgi:hypothetical protein